MDSARPSNPSNLYYLNEAAKYLAVSVDILLTWNEHNILKPTITSSGEIVYTQNQLDKFKSIQNTSKIISHEIPQLSHKPLANNTEGSQKHLSVGPPIKQNNNFSQINNYHFHNHNTNPNKEIKATISLKKLAFTFSFFAVVLILVIIAQQTNLNPILNNNSEKGVAYDSHSATIETTNEKIAKNTINNEITKNDNNLDDALKTGDKNSTSNNVNNENELLQSIIGVETASLAVENETANEVVTYGQKANLRNTNDSQDYSQNSDTQTEVFDTEGNIKVSKTDPSEKELLATALGTTGLSQSQELVKQSTGTAGVITFAILGLLFVYFLYSSKRQLSHANGNYNELNLQPVSFNTQNDLQWEKILEVTQKTDGSVMIIFQGNQYKVSKPELDSESDKLIERLMQLTNSGEKEIEYDALTDETLSLSSPLSKIVTRLGFIGLKRDLFFPRTSKSRVYFRKFLTLDDLFSMNLTIEDLSDKIESIN